MMPMKGEYNMSYGITNPCYNCKKQAQSVGGVPNDNPCKDLQKVMDAVNAIHNSNDGTHQGAGQVILLCTKIDPINK